MKAVEMTAWSRLVVQAIVAAAFLALLTSLSLLLPLVGRMRSGDDRQYIFLLFGPVSSLYTHASIVGLLLGATPILALLLYAGAANKFRVLMCFLAIVLWLIEGAIFSLMI